MCSSPSYLLSFFVWTSIQTLLDATSSSGSVYLANSAMDSTWSFSLDVGIDDVSVDVDVDVDVDDVFQPGQAHRAPRRVTPCFRVNS